MRLNRDKNVQAVFSALRLMRLAVKIKGDGKVRSYPPGLSCEKGFCKGRFPIKTKVILKAIPASGKVFSGWRGVCGGKGKCAVRLNRHKSLGAVFSPPRLMRLVVRIKGDGKVQSVPPRLSCRNGYCTGRFPAGEVVKLIPKAGAEQYFSGWRGACRGVDECRVKLKRHKLVGAIFEPQGPPSMMSLEATIVGEGSITSQPSGLSCTTGTCVAEFDREATVMLLATPKDGHQFSGWSGACAGTENCVVTMTTPNTVTAPMAVMATFIPIPSPPVALSVTIQGEGEVTSDPKGLNCLRETCVAEFDPEATVMLMATPKAGHQFSGWSGACAGTENCVVTMTTPNTVTAPMAVMATFIPIPSPPVALSVTIQGEGEVTSDPKGLNCLRETCVAEFDPEATVMLMATPKAGHQFSGWSGACAGTENCVVTMTTQKSVTATFTPIVSSPGSLTVTVLGLGEVVGNSGGLSCFGPTCVFQLPGVSTVDLNAIPFPGEQFLGWSGACMGAGSCTVAIAGPMAVTATFTAPMTGLTDQEAKRFLEQATWGPTPALMAHVKAIGKEAFLNEQFAMNV
ncbi:MAG: InlB B-repeat-containing protein, partial [Nitrospirales bacterium]